MAAVVNHGDAHPSATSQRIADAVVRTVAYGDVFDFAPTVNEVHRYLVGERATLADVVAVLADRASLDGRITVRDGLVALAGREELLALRRRRRVTSATLYRRAVRYARAIGSLPLVQMVAITGGLAPGNAEEGSDMDLFLVTERGRLWLARAEAIAVVRYASRRGDDVCPNYLVASSSLRLPTHDLYAAQELVRMQPIVGGDVYRAMRAANRWTEAFLPNSDGPPAGSLDAPQLLRRGRRLATAAFRSPLWAPVEAWEQHRKIRRFRRQAGRAGPLQLETSFGPDHCKGHFEAHGERVRTRYAAICERLGVAPMWEAAA